MVARDFFPLAIILREEAIQEDSRRSTGIDELFVGGRENSSLHLHWDKKKIVSGAISFSCSIGLRTGSRRAYSSAAQDRPEEGGEVDAGTPGDVRRPGRDLSRNDELRSSRCAAWATPRMIRSSFARMDEFEKLGIEAKEASTIPDAAVYFAGVGYRAGDLRAGRGRCVAQ